MSPLIGYQPYSVKTAGYNVPISKEQYNLGSAQQLEKNLIQPQNQFTEYGELQTGGTSDSYSYKRNIVITSIQIFGDMGSAAGTQMLLKAESPASGVKTFWGIYLRSTSSVFKEYQERTFNPPYFIPTASGTTLSISATAIPAGNVIKYVIIGYEVDF